MQASPTGAKHPAAGWEGKPCRLVVSRSWRWPTATFAQVSGQKSERSYLGEEHPHHDFFIIRGRLAVYRGAKQLFWSLFPVVAAATHFPGNGGYAWLQTQSVYDLLQDSILTALAEQFGAHLD